MIIDKKETAPNWLMVELNRHWTGIVVDVVFYDSMVELNRHWTGIVVDVVFYDSMACY